VGFLWVNPLRLRRSANNSGWRSVCAHLRQGHECLPDAAGRWSGRWIATRLVAVIADGEPRTGPQCRQPQTLAWHQRQPTIQQQDSVGDTATARRLHGRPTRRRHGFATASGGRRLGTAALAGRTHLHGTFAAHPATRPGGATRPLEGQLAPQQRQHQQQAQPDHFRHSVDRSSCPATCQVSPMVTAQRSLALRERGLS
jgi:hypothetical protein